MSSARLQGTVWFMSLRVLPLSPSPGWTCTEASGKWELLDGTFPKLRATNHSAALLSDDLPLTIMEDYLHIMASNTSGSMVGVAGEGVFERALLLTAARNFWWVCPPP